MAIFWWQNELQPDLPEPEPETNPSAPPVEENPASDDENDIEIDDDSPFGQGGAEYVVVDEQETIEKYEEEEPTEQDTLLSKNDEKQTNEEGEGEPTEHDTLLRNNDEKPNKGHAGDWWEVV